MHPFDIRTVVFAKHAQHVVLVHFPIALFTAGVLFDFLSHWTERRSLGTAAHWNFLAAALAAIPTAVTGILAWQWQLEGQRPKGILLMHLGLGWLSTVLIWIVWLVHRKAQGKQETLPGYRLGIEAVAVIILTVTGHLGGFLSGVNLPG